jgi:hypothetical protein
VEYRAKDGSFEFAKKYPLSERYHGANDLYFLDDGSVILTSAPRKMFHAKTIEDLTVSNATDLSRHFKGTPYYISSVDGELVVPEITEYSRIARYPCLHSDSCFDRRTVVHDFGPPTEISQARKAEFPK